jgi:hypothetical protein
MPVHLDDFDAPGKYELDDPVPDKTDAAKPRHSMKHRLSFLILGLLAIGIAFWRWEAKILGAIMFMLFILLAIVPNFPRRLKDMSVREKLRFWRKLEQ